MKRIICTLFLSLTLLSCNKNDDNPINTNSELPIARIISPSNNSIIPDNILIEIEASDNKGITKVEIYIDDETNTERTLVIPPYRYNWMTNQLVDSSKHSIYAKAYDGDGNITSTEVFYVTILRFSPPTGIDFISLSSNSIELKWKDNSITEEGFQIEFSIGANFQEIGKANANDTSFVITNLDSTVKYYFRVRAYNQNNYSGYSASLNLEFDISPVFLYELSAHTADASIVSIHPQQQIFASGGYNQNSAKVWDLKTGNLLSTLVSNSATFDLHFHPIANQLVQDTYAESAKIWDISNSTIIGNFSGGGFIEISDNGNYIVLLSQIFDYNSRTKIKTIGDFNQISYSTFSSTSNLLVTAYKNDSLIVTNTLTWEKLFVINDNWVDTYGIDFNPKRDEVALISQDQKLKVFDLNTRSLKFEINLNTPLSIKYHPYGKYIISTGFDGKLKFLDAETGELKKIKDLNFYSNVIRGMDISRDGNYLVAGTSSAGKILVLDTSYKWVRL